MPGTGKPPLELGVEITTANGTRFQWGKGSSVPGDVPENLSFNTRLGDGFADASVTLSRRIDRDWPDVNLFDNCVFYGADGSVAYEGRVGANPRTIDANHSMQVVFAGWMAHTRDRKAQVLFVDRDLGNWTAPGTGRRIALIPTFGVQDAQVASDDNLKPALVTTCTGPWLATFPPISEAWYDARGQAIASLYYAWSKGSTVNAADVNWNWSTSLSLDDTASSSDGSTNLRNTGPGTGTLTATTATRKFAVVLMNYAAVAQALDNQSFPIFWTCLAVYGTHGLSTVGTGDAVNAPGLLVSDMIRYLLATYCPKLDTSGITATTYAVQQAAYLDPTDPFDIIADLNKYHRWQFGVWENHVFKFAPVDLTDYDWSVDEFDPGFATTLQGDSTDDGAYNGIAISYTNLLSGKAAVIDPTTNPELIDSNPENPANKAGIQRWFYPPTLSAPTDAASASQIGQALLAEKSTPKGQGSITVRGHLRDRAGHWQQAWKVRAGDRVAITSSVALSDRPRLISETSWDNESKTLTITVEDTAQRVDAVLDRLSTALSAAGLA